jgi:hypothetical protein
MQEGQQPTAEKPVAAFVLSLLAGLWMLATGTMMSGVGEWEWADGGATGCLGSHVRGPHAGSAIGTAHASGQEPWASSAGRWR